jgi:hypothetical protein
MARHPYVRMKANLGFLQKLINLPDQYPRKPLDISNQIQINFDPLTKYRQWQEFSQLSHSKDDHFDFSSPTPLPKYRSLEDYNQKGGTGDNINNNGNVNLPLIQRRCAVTDPETSNDNEPPPLRRRRYDDSLSSDDGSDDNDESPHLPSHEDDGDATNFNSPPVVRKKSMRLAFINHAFVEAANLSRDLSPLSPEDDQYFTLTKLTIYHSCNAGELPIVIDSGDSMTFTPVLSDFIGPLPASRLTSLQGLSAKSSVVGEGTICWSIRDALDQVH